MAQMYTPMTTWPQKWYELHRAVLRMDGLHYTLQEGRTMITKNERSRLLVKPIYNGYTWRFFYFAGKKEGETFLGLEWQEDSKWACRVIVQDGVVKTQSGKSSSAAYENFHDQNVNVGDIYTLALRTEDQVHCNLYFNDTGPENIYMKTIHDGDNYKLWQASGNHVVLSMHFYNESSKATPHLGDHLYLDQFDLPVGAYGTYAVHYTGTDEAVTVTCTLANSELKFTFDKKGELKNGELFFCIVRLTPSGLAVSMSFDPDLKFQPAGGQFRWLCVTFDKGSISNAHIVSPY